MAEGASGESPSATARLPRAPAHRPARGRQPHRIPTPPASLEAGGELPANGPEPWLIALFVAGMAVLPLWDVLSRKLGTLRLAGSSALVQHFTLCVTFAGAALAARGGRLLSLSTTAFLPDRARAAGLWIAAACGTGIAAVLAVASWQFLQAERPVGELVALGLRVWWFELALLAGFAAIAVWTAWNAGKSATARLLATAGILVPLALAFVPGLNVPSVRNLLLAAIAFAAVAGMPVYATLAGCALVLFWSTGNPVAAVPVAIYSVAANPMLPAIPLFTLAGHVLSAGGASRRLVRVFNALVGWMPGGLAIVTTVVFAFFASFTGASGVTILSMGGLILPILIKSRYPENFSIGLVTATGSIGLLFPPSLPVILYGVRSLTIVDGKPYVAAIDELFIAGAIPGLFLAALVALWGVRQARRSGATRSAFDAREAVAAARETKWELLIPVAIMFLIFGGYATLVETAALTLVWAVVAECWLYRDLGFRKDMLRVVAEGGGLVGAVLLLLGAALGFTNYLVDAHLPEVLAGWMTAHVSSPLVFLLLLNICLVIVGSIIEIYSAILVVVPLITPMAAAFGIDPVHLGIIFLANLELGYLTPPFGLNVLLSSSRFGKPMVEVARATFPFLVIMTIGVLLITYVPFMSLGLLHFLRR